MPASWRLRCRLSLSVAVPGSGRQHALAVHACAVPCCLLLLPQRAPWPQAVPDSRLQRLLTVNRSPTGGKTRGEEGSLHQLRSDCCTLAGAHITPADMPHTVYHGATTTVCLGRAAVSGISIASLLCCVSCRWRGSHVPHPGHAAAAPAAPAAVRSPVLTHPDLPQRCGLLCTACQAHAAMMLTSVFHKYHHGSLLTQLEPNVKVIYLCRAPYLGPSPSHSV